MSNWQRLVWNQREALLAGLGVTVEACAMAFAFAVVFAAAWLALGLQSSGYLAETFRGGIEVVPRGHREAA
jgi:polar amino acid transport system permease protein